MPTSATTNYPTDIIEILEDLAQRIQALEQNAGFITDAGSNQFPGGIILGSGGSTQLIDTNISPPTGLVLTPQVNYNSGQINVQWTAPTDGSASSYEVDWAVATPVPGAPGTYTFGPPTAATTGGTAYLINNLAPGTYYGVYVVARNAIGRPSTTLPAGGAYQVVQVGKDLTLPVAVSGAAVFAGLSSITVYWNDNPDVDVAGGVGSYEIQVDTVTTFSSQSGSPLYDKMNVGTVVSFTNLQPNTVYYVRVRAIDSSNNAGPWTATMNATTGVVTNSNIVAGTLSADRIVGSSITGAQIHGGTITGDKIAGFTITAGNIQSGTITTTQLSSLQLLVGQYIRSNNYVAGSAGWNIAADGTAEFSNVAVRSSTFSGTIEAGTSIQSPSIVGGSIQTLAYNNTYVKLVGTGAVYPYLEWIDLTGNFSIAGGSNNFTIASNPGAGITGAGNNITLNLGGVNIQFTSSPTTIDSGLSALKFISGGLQARTSGDGGYATFTASSIQSAANMTCGTTFHVGGAGVGTAETVDGGGIIVNGTFGNGYSLSMAYSGFAPGWVTSSSMKLKTSIRSVDDEDLFDRIARVRAVRFNRKLTVAKSSKIIRKGEIGFIAEELRDIYPEAVEEVSDTLGINYLSLVPVLFEAVKRLHTRVKELEAA